MRFSSSFVRHIPSSWENLNPYATSCLIGVETMLEIVDYVSLSIFTLSSLGGYGWLINTSRVLEPKREGRDTVNSRRFNNAAYSLLESLMPK